VTKTGWWVTGLMSLFNLTDSDKNILRDIARQSIAYGLTNQRALPVKTSDFSPLLQTLGASFVTLNLHHQLRGCIGTLEAHQSLVNDVSEHAYAAAFEDPRFNPVTENEINQLDIHISILTPAHAIQFTSEQDLLEQLQPGKDGLILQAGRHKATFLPSVWEQLTASVDFLNHLKVKAGLNKADWPEDIQVLRYSTISF